MLPGRASSPAWEGASPSCRQADLCGVKGTFADAHLPMQCSADP
jgi:hypothetical protein